VANKGQISKQFHHQQKINKGFLAECYLLQNPWFEDLTCLTSLSNNLTLDSWESDYPTFNDLSDPRILAARTNTSKYNDDNPSFDTATHGPFQAEFWQVMRVESNTLENECDCWELVPHPGNTRKTMFCKAPGHSRSNVTPKVESTSSKLDFLLGATTRRKESTCSKLGLWWFNGQQSTLLWFLQQS
jgi:hypothetical protein